MNRLYHIDLLHVLCLMYILVIIRIQFIGQMFFENSNCIASVGLLSETMTKAMVYTLYVSNVTKITKLMAVFLCMRERMDLRFKWVKPLGYGEGPSNRCRYLCGVAPAYLSETRNDQWFKLCCGVAMLCSVIVIERAKLPLFHCVQSRRCVYVPN